MNPILSALNSGHSAEEVLQYMSKAIPGIAEPIKRASRLGYNTQQILGYLSKSVAPRQTKGMSESEIHAQNRLEDSQRVKNGLTIAASAVASPIAANAARSALSRALPAAVQSLSPSTGQTSIPSTSGVAPGAASNTQGMLAQPQQQNPLPNPSQPPVNGTNIPQQQALPLAEVNSTDVLKSANFTSKIDPMIDSGNDAETISAFYKKFNPQAVTQIEKQAAKPFEQVVSEYIQSRTATKPPEEMPPETGGQEPPKLPRPAPPTRVSGTSSLSRKSIQETFDKATPPAKGYIVETPDGIGEVKEIRNGKALVEVDGKMRKMLEEELMSPGIPQQDLATLHDELIEGIKRETGKEVSRHVETAGYDPEHKELIYRPWGDKEYVYDNIDPEDVEMLTNLLTQRKTTGENFIGAWEAGSESPIGAAMHALITKIRNKAKEEGKEKAHKRRYESVYSAYEPAQKASKQKKDEEKKRLRDEEKRRKAKEKQSLKHSRSTSGVS